MTQIDELVKRARWLSKDSRAASDAKHYADLADALEAQAARVKELEKDRNALREHVRDISRECNEGMARIASLEAELEVANKQIAETGRAWTADRDSLRAKLERAKEELRELMHAYVNLLEIGHDCILSLGGECDPVDTMERGDTALIRARAFLSELSADAPAPQTQISDEAVDAALNVYWNRPMDNEHHTRMRAAITAAIEWRKEIG